MGIILFTVLLYIFVGKRLKTISKAVNEVANGNLEVKIDSKGKDELSQLSRDFNKMTHGLQSNDIKLIKIKRL